MLTLRKSFRLCLNSRLLRQNSRNSLLSTRQDELQKKAEAYDKESSTLPETIKQRREKELNELYQRIQETYQTNQQALQQAQQEKLTAIHSKLQDAVKAVGQEGGYVYIMETGAGIPYISTTLSTDVTEQVKKKLGL